MKRRESRSHSEAPICWCQEDGCGARAVWLAVAVFDSGICAGALACEDHVNDALETLNEGLDTLDGVASVLLVDLKRAPAWNRVR